MNDREKELISVVLRDATPSTELKRWLRTDAGRHTRAAYRDTLRALRDGLNDRALARDTAPIYYATIKSPIGRVLVAATSTGLARVTFASSEDAFVNELRQRLHAEVIRSADRIGGILEQMDAYFAGQRRSFDVPVDWTLTTPFQQRVLDATRRVPPGELVSYGDIARTIGQPKASRAVGQALGHNPIPIVIPCHRIIASDGSLGGYTGGLTIKKKLLALEGAPCP
jgi:methylated-DNA-[protein]-cysteine S-methyltransferase